jgi:iron complex transport system substrate-binding protein
VAVLALLLLGGCGKKERPVDRPLRVVTLTPSATELVHALGATGLLVGVDEFSTFPPEVADLPKVGSFLAPNLEAILRLDPDLVITDDIHADLEDALGDAGIESLTCDMHSLRDVRAGLEKVARRLGRPEEGARAVAAIDAAVDAAGARRHARAPRVLAVIDREVGGLGNLVAAGPGSWIDELLAIVGARNVLAAAGVRYPKITSEEILRGAPEVIVDASYVATPERSAADWASVSSVPAVRDGRIVVLEEPYFLSPSPRVALALAALETALYKDGE